MKFGISCSKLKAIAFAEELFGFLNKVRGELRCEGNGFMAQVAGR